MFVFQGQEHGNCTKAVCPPKYDPSFICVFPSYAADTKVIVDCPIAQFGEAFAYCDDEVKGWSTLLSGPDQVAFVNECNVDEFWEVDEKHTGWFSTTILNRVFEFAGN